MGTKVQPGVDGGSLWSPVAVHPGLGLAFISGVVQSANYLASPERRPRPGTFRLGGLPLPKFDAKQVKNAGIRPLAHFGVFSDVKKDKDGNRTFVSGVTGARPVDFQLGSTFG